MIDLPTAIALLAPVLLLFVLDQVMRRLFARRRPRALDAQVLVPQALGSSAVGVASAVRAAGDRAAADSRRVA